ncbi:hypothetical protein BaRGS_00012583 [Batillaria attramentaria]|uniref:Uncharacterized protein n=1 Tax=Batillaria attramentaria TaxID=370345 RepID=A0ABD0LAD8_9CAEN
MSKCIHVYTPRAHSTAHRTTSHPAEYEEPGLDDTWRQSSHESLNRAAHHSRQALKKNTRPWSSVRDACLEWYQGSLRYLCRFNLSPSDAVLWSAIYAAPF